MTKMIESIPAAELVTGKAYNVVRRTNALGQPMLNIRRADWRAVMLTAENIGQYGDGSYYIQPIKDSRAPRLLAAGWVKFSTSRGECGQEIVTRGPLYGLACSKPAVWQRAGGFPACIQHATITLEYEAAGK